MRQKIGDALREARLAAGLKQGELAHFLAISQAFLSDIENGRRGLPEERYVLLPAPIRFAVAKAWVASLQEEMARALTLAESAVELMRATDADTGC